MNCSICSTKALLRIRMANQDQEQTSSYCCDSNCIGASVNTRWVGGGVELLAPQKCHCCLPACLLAGRAKRQWCVRDRCGTHGGG